MEINVEHLPDAAEGATDAALAAVHLSADMPDVAIVAVGLMGAGLILFVLFVLPLWLFLYYRSRARHLPMPVAPPANSTRSVSADDLADLARLAERIEHRLDAVETLMDAENPRWRR